MLVFSIILMLIGTTLVYSSLSGQGYWKAPWKPVTQYFSRNAS